MSPRSSVAWAEVMAVARPGVVLREVPGVDEVVLHGGGEVFRLPLAEGAATRQRVLVKALPALFAKLPVAVPRPRFVGVLADGTTPFTAEKRLPGTDLGRAAGIACAQWEGVMAALDAVSPGTAVVEWR